MIQLAKEQASKTRWTVLISGMATTFIVWTSLADPINIPKMFILAIFSAWVLGTVVVVFSPKDMRKISLGQWAVIAFAFGIVIAGVLTDVRYIAFFGASQRNDGAIAYLALAILAIAAMASFDSSHTRELRTGFLIVGGVLTFYGLVQTTGNDPLKWALEYGPVIGTLGNPDFMSAVIGVCSVATVWMLLVEKEMKVRTAAGIFLILELFVLKRTGSIQGILAFAIGLGILLLAKLWQLNRRYGLIATIVGGIFAIPVFLGFINAGPLASHLFRTSLRNRMDYWHAAIEMFKAHPLFGVGLERFGENYGLYAPQVQVVHGQITNNAHNVFLQLLATGGLVVLLPYLFLIGIILFTVVKALGATRGQAQLDLVAIASIWVALLLVSIISIDNLGVAVWFWISGGALYAIAHESMKGKEEKPKQKKTPGKKGRISAPGNSSYLAPIISLVLSILVLILLVPSWRTSSAIYDLQANRSLLSPSQYIAKMDQVGNIWPRNPVTNYSLADIALRIKNPELSLKYVAITLKEDPKSNFGNQLGAIARETEKKYSLALPYRIRLIQIDPWNTSNMLQLVQDYVYLKDLTNAQAIATKINHLYPSSADAVAAAKLVKG